jgi:hypothetical protein
MTAERWAQNLRPLTQPKQEEAARFRAARSSKVVRLGKKVLKAEALLAEVRGSACSAPPACPIAEACCVHRAGAAREGEPLRGGVVPPRAA